MCPTSQQAAGLALALVQLRNKHVVSVTREQIISLASQVPSTGLAGLPAIAFHYPDFPASMALLLPTSGLGSITITSPRALHALSLVKFLPYPNQQFHLFG